MLNKNFKQSQNRSAPANTAQHDSVQTGAGVVFKLAYRYRACVHRHLLDLLKKTLYLKREILVQLLDHAVNSGGGTRGLGELSPQK